MAIHFIITLLKQLVKNGREKKNVGRNVGKNTINAQLIQRREMGLRVGTSNEKINHGKFFSLCLIILKYRLSK